MTSKDAFFSILIVQHAHEWPYNMTTTNKTHPVEVADPTRKTNSILFAFLSISFLHTFEAVQLSRYTLAIAKVTNVDRRVPEVKNAKRRS